MASASPIGPTAVLLRRLADDTAASRGTAQGAAGDAQAEPPPLAVLRLAIRALVQRLAELDLEARRHEEEERSAVVRLSLGTSAEPLPGAAESIARSIARRYAAQEQASAVRAILRRLHLQYERAGTIAPSRGGVAQGLCQEQRPERGMP